MRNTLGDLNNHLFEQLERLNDDELVGDELAEEINRSKAVGAIAQQIIQNGALVLQASKVTNNSMSADAKVPKMLEGDTNA